jgi:predicted outer membrane repeat protein
VASGIVELDRVTFAGNYATASGGAVALTGAGALYARNVTFSGNGAQGSGGTLYAQTTGGVALGTRRLSETPPTRIATA